MRFILQPSLLNIALVQVTANLFNQHDVRELLRKFSCSQSVLLVFSNSHKRREEWKKIEESVIDKVSELTIPTSLKQKLLGYIQPIGIEICKCVAYHFRLCAIDLDLLNNLCWTSHGTIDKTKTAEMLIKDEAIDVTTRNILACVYCLEDAIPKLWHKLSESHKLHFSNEKNIGNNFQKKLLFFWGHYISAKEASKDNTIGRLNPISFSDSYMLQCAAETGNKAATKYFLQKLIEKKHPLDEVLLKTAINVAKKCALRVTFLHYSVHPQEYYSEVFCFLLSQITDKQQLQLFKECPTETLRCLLDWPWQNLYVETVSCLFSFLSDSYQVLKIIIDKVDNGYHDYDYQKLFRAIWEQMPHAEKTRNINNARFFYVLHDLLKIKDYENIKFIFQDIPLTKRKKFLFSHVGQIFSNNLIYREEWDLLKFFISLSTSSKDEMITFKKEFQEHFQRVKMMTSFQSSIIVSKRDKQQEEFFQHLDELIRGHDKRKSLDDGQSNIAKRPGDIEFNK